MFLEKYPEIQKLLNLSAVNVLETAILTSLQQNKVSVYVYGRMERWVDGRMDQWMDGWMDIYREIR